MLETYQISPLEQEIITTHVIYVTKQPLCIWAARACNQTLVRVFLFIHTGECREPNYVRNMIFYLYPLCQAQQLNSGSLVGVCSLPKTI